MSHLTPELQARLQDLELRKDFYEPADKEIRRAIARVTIILIVGAVGIGKSRVIEKVRELDPSITEPTNYTNRHRRPNDPPHYRTDLSHEQLIADCENGKVVQYGLHPSGDIYATYADSYRSAVVIQPTLSSAIAQIEGLGFKGVRVVGILAHGKAWQKQLAQRGDIAPVRFEEARQSTKWLLENKEQVALLENIHGQPEYAAHEIVNLAQGNPVQRLGRAARMERLAGEMLEVAKQRLAEPK